MELVCHTKKSIFWKSFMTWVFVLNVRKTELNDKEIILKWYTYNVLDFFFFFFERKKWHIDFDGSNKIAPELDCPHLDSGYPVEFRCESTS